MSPWDESTTSCFLSRSVKDVWVLGDRADHEMETVPPLFVTSPEKMLPDPGGGELKQLCTKGTLHKSCLTLERERSDHRRAVIMKGRSQLFFPPRGSRAGPWSVSISAFLSRKGGYICGEDDARSSGSSRQTRSVAVACLRTHTEELRKEKGSLRGPTTLCVCL